SFWPSITPPLGISSLLVVPRFYRQHWVKPQITVRPKMGRCCNRHWLWLWGLVSPLPASTTNLAICFPVSPYLPGLPKPRPPDWFFYFRFTSVGSLPGFA